MYKQLYIWHNDRHYNYMTVNYLVMCTVAEI